MEVGEGRRRLTLLLFPLDELDELELLYPYDSEANDDDDPAARARDPRGKGLLLADSLVGVAGMLP